MFSASKTNLLPQRIRTKTSTAVHPVIDISMLASLEDIDGNPRADGRTIRLPSDQLDLDSVVHATRILVQAICSTIARKGTTHLLKHVLISILVDIRKGDRMAFL